jgi:hypothetical protein
MLSHSPGGSSRDGRELTLHAKVQVAEVITSRYDQGAQISQDTRTGYRPPAWDGRREGLDTVRTSSGEILRLFSTGAQSIPKPGWVIVITGGTFEEGYTWTLYGIPAAH